MLKISSEYENTGTFRQIIGEVCFEPGAKVYHSEFLGPAFVDRRCKIGPQVEVGRYVGFHADTYVSRCTIGAFCAFGGRNAFNPFNHPTEWLSTHEFQYHTMSFDWVDEYNDFERLPRDAAMAGRVTIGNDVWTGHNVCIMSGVSVGDGAVIGAGAVVTKDVPPYAIVAGVPAKIIRYRFPEDIISRLLALRWWERPLATLSGLPFDRIELCLDQLEEEFSCMS